MKRLLLIPFFALSILSCKKEDPEPVDPPSDPVETDTTQLDLLPHFGQLTAPSSSDPICSYTSYLGNFDDNAIAVGEKVNDFTLYNTDGNATNLENKLLEGKPVFIMTGSYTCPVFRNSISELNQLMSSYSADINFFVVYTLEAHPIIDNSAYADSVWTTQQNQNDGILYEQPDTYGDRLATAVDMITAIPVNCPVLLDNACNEFWTTYGEAPNRAYLIDTQGVVQISHGWFHYPSMVNSIDIFLAG